MLEAIKKHITSLKVPEAEPIIQNVKICEMDEKENTLYKIKGFNRVNG